MKQWRAERQDQTAHPSKRQKQKEGFLGPICGRNFRCSDSLLRPPCHWESDCTCELKYLQDSGGVRGVKEGLTERHCDTLMRIFTERKPDSWLSCLPGQDDILAMGGTWGFFPLTAIKTHSPTPDHSLHQQLLHHSEHDTGLNTCHPLSIEVHFLGPLST